MDNINKILISGDDLIAFINVQVDVEEYRRKMFLEFDMSVKASYNKH